MPISSPYGTWKSPIVSDLIVAESVRLSNVVLDGDDVYWLEGRPREGGRNALVRLSRHAPPTECLPPEFNVRTRVHEYGGGAYAVFGGHIYFVNFRDQRLYRQSPGAAPQRLTPDEGYRYADFILDSRRNRLICVREDHTGGGEPRNALVAVSLEGGDAGTVLVEGHDFYASPRLSPDGRHLAYLAWNHPNMPWDGTELWVAEINADGQIESTGVVAGGKDESIFQPEWSPAGVLHFVSDRSGWWNLYRLGDSVEPLYPAQAEFGMPQWVFGMRTYAFLNEEEILCTFTAGDGLWRMARLNVPQKRLIPLDLPFTFFSSLQTNGREAVFLAASPTHPLSVIRLDPDSVTTGVLRRAFEPTVPPAYFSVPRPIEFPTANGQTGHAFFYPPTNPAFVAPPGELPPLLVHSHGGPTSASVAMLDYATQYWTSRGFAVVDVNYGGSSGYGRAYRQRLNGRWGIVDVEDCVNAARYLAGQGWVDGRRMAIAGGSAGGFTTLAALTFTNVFSAGTSYFGVSDLEALARDTHKFESHYLDTLIGPYPACRDLYLERSPIHHLEQLSTPILLLQGDSDPVVPPNQAESMFQAAKARGIPTAYLLFEGEQHGFRKAETIKRALEAELYFYSRVFSFTPADSLEPIPIENEDRLVGRQ